VASSQSGLKFINIGLKKKPLRVKSNKLFNTFIFNELYIFIVGL